MADREDVRGKTTFLCGSTLSIDDGVPDVCPELREGGRGKFPFESRCRWHQKGKAEERERERESGFGRGARCRLAEFSGGSVGGIARSTQFETVSGRGGGGKERRRREGACTGIAGRRRLPSPRPTDSQLCQKIKACFWLPPPLPPFPAAP